MKNSSKLGIFVVLNLIAQIAGAGAVGEAVKDIGKAVFSDVERAVIREYYEAKYGPMDRRRERDGGRDYDHDRDDDYDRDRKGKKNKKYKGKGNPQGLPPGIAKKLDRGGELPPGIAKKNLPSDLESRLPPPPRGYERVEIDGDIVLVQTTTDTITDIIRRVEALQTDAERDRTEPRGRGLPTDRRDRDDAARSAGKPDKGWWEFWKD